MSRSDARCATPYIYSGELQIRPEVDAALAALKDKPYTAIPSWKNDGTWEPVSYTHLTLPTNREV